MLVSVAEFEEQVRDIEGVYIVLRLPARMQVRPYYVVEKPDPHALPGDLANHIRRILDRDDVEVVMFGPHGLPQTF